jgi:hypothetical protein
MAQDKVSNRVYGIHAATPLLLLGWHGAIPLSLVYKSNGGTLIYRVALIRLWNL